MTTRIVLKALFTSLSLAACGGSSAASFDAVGDDASVASLDASQAAPSHGAHPPPGHDGGSLDAAPPHAGDAGLGADGSSGSGIPDAGKAHDAASGSTHTCAISGVTYQKDDINPDDICEWCAPAQSETAWSNITDGAGCGTDEACFGGICTSHFPDCVIDGTAYAPNTASPTNACALCQPRQSETSWTNAPDGTACPGGGCFAGACD